MIKKFVLLVLFFTSLFADPKTYAEMALHSYDKNPNWFQINGFKVIEYNQSLNSYVVEKDNQTYIIFRGTGDLKDIMLDGLQEFGLSKIRFKTKTIEKGVPQRFQDSTVFVEKYKDKNPILIGHSLGGGISTYCGLIYDLKVVTFNPAPLSLSSLKDLNLSKNKIENFISYNKFQPDLIAGSALIKNHVVGKINLVNIPLDDNLTKIQRIMKIHSMKELYSNI